MRRSIVGSLVAASLGLGGVAQAQGGAPDIRNIRPIVFLAVDTSGSMERDPTCVCTTPTCEECLPMCGGATSAKNRWAIVTESLTGSMPAYSCTIEPRTSAAYAGQFDYGYHIPHVKFNVGVQNNDGILDAYRDRVRFGLMTFDGSATLLNGDPLVTKTNFLMPGFLADSQSERGMYSYGLPREFMLPGCPDTYMIDNGGRSKTAPTGTLVSVGPAGGDDGLVNANVQQTLLNVRPFGATPIAGILDDVRYYLGNDSDVAKPTAPGNGDIYYECRDRYVLLLTDGYPNQEFRGDPYFCESPGGSCPYQRPEDIAADLCQYDPGLPGCRGRIKGLFVIGFALDDPAAVGRLNDIAALGGTKTALYANDRNTLMSKLAEVLDQAAPGTTTRTVPVNTSGLTATGVPSQNQFTTGFNVGSSTTPWSGVLERTRFECNENLEPIAQPISDTSGDRFQTVLTQRVSPRRLLTVIPQNAVNATKQLQGQTFSIGQPSINSSDVLDPGPGIGTGGPSCGAGANVSPAKSVLGPAETGLTLEAFSLGNSRVTASLIGASNETDRSEVINWVDAGPGSVRSMQRLGDIYHSSPVTVGVPSQDISDESFNLFRQRPEVVNRPTMVYVGTNDGILHAFASQRTEIKAGPHAGTTVEAGEELWGFIPPFLLPKLKSATVSHQWMMDGTVVVRDVFLQRQAGAAADGTAYHTVLIAGLRGGGGAYFALDVTDPLSPQFLWQFASPELIAAYGQAGVGQIVLNEGGSGSLQERAVAALPGGTSQDLTGTGGTCGAAANPPGCSANGKGSPPVTTGTTGARAKIHCWASQGRNLYFVDVATGTLLRQFDDRAFNSPLTGSVSFFTGDTGTIATRAFVTDADAFIWRVDLSSPKVRDWSVTPLHDMFWDSTALAAQPANFPPVVSTDSQGRVVVIQATGDVDKLDGLGENRVASITEQITFNTSTGKPTAVSAALNWQLSLTNGEQVTGPLELYNSRVYFGTFRPANTALDACAFGESRIWGVSYREAQAGTTLPKPGLESNAGSGTFDLSYIGPFANQIVMGVTVTQRPTCFVGRDEVDPYSGKRYVVQQTGGGSFQLVAQVSGGGSKTGGANVATFTRQLPAPLAFTRVQSWAGSVDQ